MKSNRRVLILAALVAAVVGFLVAASVFRGVDLVDLSGSQPETPAATPTPAAVATPAVQAATSPAAQQPRPAGGEPSVFQQIFEGADVAQVPLEPRNLLEIFLTVTLRLTLAAILAALLAFRPRRQPLFARRNPYVAQTQILVAVVASALMMIVGDNAGRAFGIFAAVSFIRFRTNIRDPKEVTVLLVSLAIGLGTGVGRWDLSVILSFFVLLLLWGLEYREQELVFRPMELTVKTRNVDTTQEALLRLFRKYRFEAEMRTLDRPDQNGELGAVVYYVSLSPVVSTDILSEEILSADTDNIDSVEWDTQKNPAQYYQ